MVQMDRGRRNGVAQLQSNGFHGDFACDKQNGEEIAITIERSSVSPPQSFHPSSPSSSSSTSFNYIEHRVSMMDTLAGVAIKYGVEVADIRRLNGLATDLQMFAHKSIRIPLHGRYPPSYPSNEPDNNTRDETPPRGPHDEILDSIQSLKLKPPRQHKVSTAMSLLQGYYGLKTPPKTNYPSPEKSTEMSVLYNNSNRTGKSLCLEDDPLLLPNPETPLPPNWHRKAHSLVNGEITEESTDSERSIRRRQKADVSPDFPSSSSGSTSRAPKGLPLRPKHGTNKTDISNKSQQNLVSIGGDSLIVDGLSLTVRKSSSTSDLQDSDSGPSLSYSSIWATPGKWGLKPDSFALPSFEGIPNPMASWRNKAARD